MGFLTRPQPSVRSEAEAPFQTKAGSTAAELSWIHRPESLHARPNFSTARRSRRSRQSNPKVTRPFCLVRRLEPSFRLLERVGP